MKKRNIETLILIHYADSDGDELFEAAEWRKTNKQYAWCLAGDANDTLLDIKEIISIVYVKSGDHVQKKIPNIALHNPNPNYIRKLIKESGLNQKNVSESIGVSSRTMREYTKLPEPHTKCPYPVQFALECLSKNKSNYSAH